MRIQAALVIRSVSLLHRLDEMRTAVDLASSLSCWQRAQAVPPRLFPRRHERPRDQARARRGSQARAELPAGKRARRASDDARAHARGGCATARAVGARVDPRR
eukprot:2639087-Pleurochrysis_carterae.AAC.1